MATAERHLTAVAARRIQARLRADRHHRPAMRHSVSSRSARIGSDPDIAAAARPPAPPPQTELREWGKNAPEGCVLERFEPMTRWVILMQGPEVTSLYSSEVFRCADCASCCSP
jgi:hypothetical protein